MIGEKMAMHVPLCFRILMKKYKIPLSFITQSTGFTYPAISNALSRKTPSSVAMAKAIFKAIEEWLRNEIANRNQECKKMEEDLNSTKEEWKRGEIKEIPPLTLE